MLPKQESSHKNYYYTHSALFSSRAALKFTKHLVFSVYCICSTVLVKRAPILELTISEVPSGSGLLQASSSSHRTWCLRENRILAHCPTWKCSLWMVGCFEILPLSFPQYLHTYQYVFLLLRNEERQAWWVAPGPALVRGGTKCGITVPTIVQTTSTWYERFCPIHRYTPVEGSHEEVSVCQFLFSFSYP